MSVSGNTSSTDDGVSLLTSKTPILGQKLYVVIAVTVAGVTGVLVLIFLFLLYKQSSKRRNNRMRVDKHGSGMLPLSSETKTINLEVKTNCSDQNEKVGKTLISMFEMDNEERDETEPIIKAVDGKKLDNDTSGSNESGTATDENQSKSLKLCRGQAEKEFKVEVEAIGKVRHKNLVGLIGFCTEGAKRTFSPKIADLNQTASSDALTCSSLNLDFLFSPQPRRLLVYEYVDNGNLEQWLHGDVGPTSPLTWDIRMKIAVGTAKGLAYLHEGLEPKVVHRDVKSSNILLDKKWNARVADFGLAKLLESEKSYVTTRVMGTFGYVSPDYASTGMLNEASDIYSFGVCLMEIVTGRSPMNLVDWFRGMVASRRGEDLVDPKIEIQPSPRALKRVLLVCLCCTDMDASMRPKMGHIVHMLEADEFPFRRVSTLFGCIHLSLVPHHHVESNL
ncbi:Protein kinase, catalytic domain-containing protein, partial [Cynara cardunculus var. scolymus]